MHNKFLPQISDGKDAFERYIETISRQVKHVRDLINEFSEFARMPAPKFEEKDILKICNQIIQFYKSAYTWINFDIYKDNNQKELFLNIDSDQIERAISNLIKNSIEVMEKNSSETPKISIKIIGNKENIIDIIIEDNGPGFPGENIEELLNPYVTHKEMGTGLGLSIVKRTMDDHMGKIILGHSSTQGASACLRFFKNIDRIT